MKKLALVAALAAALPVLAHADVTIYGTVAVGIESYDNGGLTKTQVDDYGSKIGFKGTEDLGNGLKSLWQVESSFNADGTSGTGTGTTDTWAGRQTFVGLQSSLGTIRLGRIHDMMVETESTDNFYGVRNDSHNLFYPVYEDGFIPGFSLGSGIDSGSGMKNVVRYDAPSWNGLDVSLLYGAGEDKTTSKGASDRYGFHINYQNAPTKLFVGAAYEAQRNQTASGKTGSLSRVESGYNGDNLTVAFTYNHASEYGDTTANTAWVGLGVNDANAHMTANSYGMYVAYAIGPFTPKFEYSQLKDATVNGQKYATGIKQYGLVLDYNLSKRTFVEAAYVRQNESSDMQTLNGDSSATSHAVSLALVHSF